MARPVFGGVAVRIDKAGIVREQMAYSKPVSRCLSYLRHSRLFSAFAASLFLVGCYATTDKLAVYESSALNRQDVEALAGCYHLIDPNGSISSLAFAVRDEPWLYKKEGLLERMGVIPFSPQLPQTHPAVDMSFKEVTHFDNADKGLWRIDGVAVFSNVPGTDLILGSIAGQTLQIYNTDKGEMTPRSEEQKNMNIFFVLKQDGKALTIKLFSENDEGLAKAFDDPSTPLPTDKLLVWLKKNAAGAFDEDNLPTYLRSTPKQKVAVEKQINAAFSEGREKQKAKKMRIGKKAEPDVSGPGVKVSAEAARRLRKAMQQRDAENDIPGNGNRAAPDDAEGQYQLARSYTDSDSATYDVAIAEYWYLKAAEQGHVEAQYQLGMLYGSGDISTDADYVFPLKFKWIKSAALQKHKDAAFQLGQAYRYGSGTEKNLEQAFYWYEVAADRGSLEAAKALADAYSSGWDVEKNPHLALYWYNILAQRGDADAYYSQGSIYQQGLVGERDYHQAAQLYAQGAMRESASAQYALAALYQEGLGVPKNLDLALSWYEKALENGKEGAAHQIDVIRAQQNPTRSPAPRKALSARETGEMIGIFLRFMADSSKASEAQQGTNAAPLGDADLAQCRAESAQYITECAKVTDYDACQMAGGCPDKVICDTRRGGCAKHDSPYGKRGIFYCDTRNWRNRDQDLETVLATACPANN